MLTPTAILSHQSNGRIRIRITEKVGDKKYFTHLQNTFANLPGIQAALINEKLGSVLLLTQSRSEDILSFAKDNNLFSMNVKQAKTRVQKSQKAKPSAPTQYKTESGLKKLANCVHNVDVAIQNSTYGILDLTTLAFAAFTGMGIYQIARGQILASGTALLTTAVALLPLQKVLAERRKSC